VRKYLGQSLAKELHDLFSRAAALVFFLHQRTKKEFVFGGSYRLDVTPKCFLAEVQLGKERAALLQLQFPSNRRKDVADLYRPQRSRHEAEIQWRDSSSHVACQLFFLSHYRLPSSQCFFFHPYL